MYINTEYDSLFVNGFQNSPHYIHENNVGGSNLKMGVFWFFDVRLVIVLDDLKDLFQP